MRIALGTLLVLLAAGSASAQARPVACRYVVDIKNATVASSTQTSTDCEYKGKVLMAVNNLDPVRYRVEIRNFKYNPSTPNLCTGATTAVTSMPINGSDNGAFKFNVGGESTSTKKKDIKAMGAQSAECFKFDIHLFADGGTTPINTMDPELDVTQPSGPPIGGKKPGDQ